MNYDLEKLIKLVYKKWRAGSVGTLGQHPDEETVACFLEDKLSPQEKEDVAQHIMSCDDCAEIVDLQLRLNFIEEKGLLDDSLITHAKGLVRSEDKALVLEIWLRLKEKALEILNTTGDILVGQELVPAPILRSRKIKDFKDEVTILKDFKDILVEVNIVNKQGSAFNLTIVAKEKDTQKIIKDLRVTLIQADKELESYLAYSGKVTFESVSLGQYKVEISSIDNKLASVLLDIKI